MGVILKKIKNKISIKINFRLKPRLGSLVAREYKNVQFKY